MGEINSKFILKKRTNAFHTPGFILCTLSLFIFVVVAAFTTVDNPSLSKLKETYTNNALDSLSGFLEYARSELSEVIVFDEPLFTHLYRLSVYLLNKEPKEPLSLTLQDFEVAYGLVVLSQPQDDGQPSKEVSGQKLPTWNKIIFTAMDSDNDGKITKSDVATWLSMLVGCSFKPESDDDDDDDDEFKFVNSLFPEEGGYGFLELEAFEKITSNIPLTLYSVFVDVAKYVSGVTLTPSKKQALEATKKESSVSSSSSGIFSFMFKKKDVSVEQQQQPKDEQTTPVAGDAAEDTMRSGAQEQEESTNPITEDFTDSEEEEEAASRRTIRVVIKPKEDVTVSAISLSDHTFLKPPKAVSSRRRVVVSERVKPSSSTEVSVIPSGKADKPREDSKSDEPSSENGAEGTPMVVSSDKKSDDNSKDDIKKDHATIATDSKSGLFNGENEEPQEGFFGSGPVDQSSLFKEVIAAEAALRENAYNPFGDLNNGSNGDSSNGNDNTNNDFFSGDVSAVPVDSLQAHVSSAAQPGDAPDEDFFSESNKEEEQGKEEDEEEDEDDLVVLPANTKKDESQSSDTPQKEAETPAAKKYTGPSKKAKKAFSECMKKMECGEYGSALDSAQEALRALPDNVHPKYPRMVMSYLMATRILESITAAKSSVDFNKISLLGTWLASLPLHRAHKEACLLIASMYSDAAARAASALIPDWSQYASQCYPNGGVYSHISCRSCKSLCDASLPRCFVCGKAVLYCCLTMNPIQGPKYKRCGFCSGTFINTLIMTDSCPLCGRKALCITDQ